MKNTTLISSIFLILLIAFGVGSSCNKKDKDIIITEEQDNLYDALRMDTALDNSNIFHDSVLYAKTHAPTHVHHYDSIFHYHDSLYNWHHTNYHHGDTTHHHSGFHHTPTQHHFHDSLLNVHHTLVH